MANALFKMKKRGFMFLFVPTGTEEARTGRWSGLACVRGSCRVPDSPEFGSFIMETISSAGKRSMMVGSSHIIPPLKVQYGNLCLPQFQVRSDFVATGFRSVWRQILVIIGSDQPWEYVKLNCIQLWNYATNYWHECSSDASSLWGC